MSKWIRHVLAAVAMGFLLWYLACHRHELSALLDLRLPDLAILYGLYLLVAVATAWVSRSLLAALGVQSPLREEFLLQNAVFLLNYVPMKLGTVYRANYLKQRYGLTYGRFGTFLLLLTVLAALGSSLVGLVVLTTVYGWTAKPNQVLGAGLSVVVLGSALVFTCPVPAAARATWIGRAWSDFVTGRELARNKPVTILKCVAALIVSFVFTSLRLWLVYSHIGQNAHPAGYLVLGAAGYVTLLVSLTPAGLGIRELVLGAVSTVLGISLQAGLLAAMLDRAVVLSYSLVAGGCSLILLRRTEAAQAELQR